jgi:hypothetical protein
MNRLLSLSSEEGQAAVAHAEEVATMLRQNIVQGKKEDENTYREPSFRGSSLYAQTLTTLRVAYTRRDRERRQ